MHHIKATLLYHTPLGIAIRAIRTCWDSHCKSDTKDINTDELGENDLDLIHRITNKYRHHSTIEHINYNYEINGISRLCLQELARHRIASFSVKSTRYTLQELRNVDLEDIENCKKYMVFYEDDVNQASIHALKEVQKLLRKKIPLDKIKYCLPEAYRTNLIFSINARSLLNLLQLRTAPSAHIEIQNLARKLHAELPDSHKKALFSTIDISNTDSSQTI